MKCTSDFRKKVETMLHSRTASLSVAAMLLGPATSLAQPSDATLPVCTGVAGPSIALRTRTLPATGQEAEVEVGEILLDATPIVIRAGSLELDAPATFSGRFLFTDFTVTIEPGPLETDEAGNHRPSNYAVHAPGMDNLSSQTTRACRWPISTASGSKAAHTARTKG